MPKRGECRVYWYHLHYDVLKVMHSWWHWVSRQIELKWTNKTGHLFYLPWKEFSFFNCNSRYKLRVEERLMIFPCLIKGKESKICLYIYLFLCCDKTSCYPNNVTDLIKDICIIDLHLFFNIYSLSIFLREFCSRSAAWNIFKVVCFSTSVKVSFYAGPETKRFVAGSTL